MAEALDCEPVDVAVVGAGFAGGASLFFWLTTIGAGRMIGYW